MNKEKMMKDYLETLDLKHIEIQQTKDSSYNMYYNVEKGIIAYNEDSLKVDKEDYPVNFEEYFEIIFCHELGHAMDTHLSKNNELINILFDKIRSNPLSQITKQYLKDLEKMKYKVEKNAWEIASGIIDKKLKEKFDIVKSISLQNAKEVAKDEVELIRNKIEIVRLSSNDSV